MLVLICILLNYLLLLYSKQIIYCLECIYNECNKNKINEKSTIYIYIYIYNINTSLRNVSTHLYIIKLFTTVIFKTNYLLP